jgi:drug/metabolite transporter (DMT)-like permease
MPRGRALDFVILAIGVVAVSTSAVLIREADAPAVTISVYRLVLASIPMLLYASFRGEQLRPRDQERLVWTVMAGICLAIHFITWVSSVKQTSIITSVVLVCTAPLFVAIASGPFLGERPGQAVWAGLALAATGTLIMVSEDFGAGSDTLLGDLYALLGALMATALFLIGRKALSGSSRDWLPFSTGTYSVAAVLLVLVTAVAGSPISGFSTETYVLLVLIAGVPQVIGHTAINRSLGVLPAFAVALAVQGEPVGATFLATVVLDEPPSAAELIGGVVVLAGVYLGLRSQASPVVAAET